MKIELTSDQLDEIAKKKIEALEKEVRSLNAKLANRDRKIVLMQDGMDISKDVRESIRDAALVLQELLEDAEWIEYDRYGARC